MRVSETVWKGRLLRRCERLERLSFVFNALVRQLPALSTPPLSLLFFFSPRSSLPDTFFAWTLESYSFIPTIACLLCFISLRNSWAFYPPFSSVRLLIWYLVAQLVGIPPMTELEATSLLEGWAGTQLRSTDPALKAQIVNRLGHLPLAIKLAGAQLQRKAPDTWLRHFHIRRLKARRPETIHDDLVLTFQMSLQDLNEEECHFYTTLAIFKANETIPQVGIEHLWHGLSGFDTE